MLVTYSTAFLTGLYRAILNAEATAGQSGYVSVKLGFVFTYVHYYGNYLTGFWGPIPSYEEWLTGMYVGPQFNVQAEGANTCLNAPLLTWKK